MMNKFLKFFRLSNNKLSTNNIDECSHNSEQHIQKLSNNTLSTDNFDEYSSNNEEHIQKIFNNNFYDENNIALVESWLFYNYLDNSDSLVEKKYKIVVLALICEQKRLYLKKMPLVNDIIKDVSQQLIEAKETEFNLIKAFPISRDFPDRRRPNQEVTGIELIPKILNEDSDKPETINIAKKIYNQFSCLGLLANTFIDSKSYTDIFMNFQDNKFNNGDMAVFQKFIQTVTDPKYDSYHSVMLNLNCWNKLILSEDNIDNLNVFKQLYLNDKGRSSSSLYGVMRSLHPNRFKDTRQEDKDYLIEFVNKRIDYLELGNDLEMPTEMQTKKTKRAKL